MAHPPATHCCLLILLLSSIAGTAYQGEEEDEEACCNDLPVMGRQIKRASNLGSRFNLGKKFIGYSWLRAVDSRQRRAPLHYSSFRPEDTQRQRHNDWLRPKSYELY